MTNEGGGGLCVIHPACRGRRHVESVDELGCVQWSGKVDGGRRSDLGVSLAQSRPRVQSNAQRTPRTVASCRGRVEQRDVGGGVSWA